MVSLIPLLNISRIVYTEQYLVSIHVRGLNYSDVLSDDWPN